ncbi:Hypothetical_protein [Hexamita inflata]|uniref:Hypothetical_protein n=1 Tax=Hexamita inflata TaxID=28002 RepID=A0AA86R3S9_9EUKA|nr:Hypothetical protein HINF_LOCUS53198 [Hexamita inflata]
MISVSKWSRISFIYEDNRGDLLMHRAVDPTKRGFACDFVQLERESRNLLQLNCKHRIQTNLTLSRWKKMKSMITRFACTLIMNEKFADLMNKKLKSQIIRLSGTYSLQNQLRLGTRESYHILSSYTHQIKYDKIISVIIIDILF